MKALQCLMPLGRRVQCKVRELSYSMLKLPCGVSRANNIVNKFPVLMCSYKSCEISFSVEQEK